MCASSILRSTSAMKRRQAADTTLIKIMHGCIVGALVTLTSSCAVGPDYRAPTAPSVSGYMREKLPEGTASSDVSGGSSQRFVEGQDIPPQWWTLFHSAPLNALIEQALSNNADLQAAQAALRVAQENYYAQRGSYYPSIAADVSSSRRKDPVQTISPNAASGAEIYNLHTAQVSVSYTLDVFGGNRRQVEALEAQAQAQRFQLEAAYLALTANVVVAALQEASLEAQITTTQNIIALETEQLILMHRQTELGQIAEANVIAQQAVLAQVQALLPALKKQREQQRDVLVALVGGFPSQQPIPAFDLASVELPQTLPVTLPSRLIAQRPDVCSAEAQLHAASAQIGVATANLLPQFTLSANAGSVATTMADLFKTGTGFWSATADVTQPIFAGGTLLHKKRAAEAAYDQAAAQYRSTVIAAFQNVADTLNALEFDAEGLKAAFVAEQSAANSLDIARHQLELGDISYLSLLSAEQTYQQAIINRIVAQTSRYADTAALFQALGGGWWNRSNSAASETFSQ